MIKFGIIGYPLRHSLSPLFWNLYFKRKNIRAVYEKIEIEPERKINLKEYKGLNVTTPWKEKILKYCDEYDEIVLNTKNANTILIDKKILAYNTDFYGFEKLMEKVEIEFKNVVIIGTGGAAKTCAYYFKKRKAYVVFLSRKKKQKIFGFDIKTYDEDIKEFVQKADIILNATPLGWYGKLPPLNFDYIRKSFLIDLQYGKNPPFLEEGKKRGIKGIDGTIMLLNQAIKAGKIWFYNFDEECFKKCFYDILKDGNA